jgi:hypothetical protein
MLSVHNTLLDLDHEHSLSKDWKTKVFGSKLTKGPKQDS